eukprot:scaffold250744_cov19-Tisochrysis_lutea.AAC.4
MQTHSGWVGAEGGRQEKERGLVVSLAFLAPYKGQQGANMGRFTIIRESKQECRSMRTRASESRENADGEKTCEHANSTLRSSSCMKVKLSSKCYINDTNCALQCNKMRCMTVLVLDSAVLYKGFGFTLCTHAFGFLFNAA